MVSAAAPLSLAQDDEVCCTLSSHRPLQSYRRPDTLCSILIVSTVSCQPVLSSQTNLRRSRLIMRTSRWKRKPATTASHHHRNHIGRHTEHLAVPCSPTQLDCRWLGNSLDSLAIRRNGFHSARCSGAGPHAVEPGLAALSTSPLRHCPERCRNDTCGLNSARSLVGPYTTGRLCKCRPYCYGRTDQRGYITANHDITTLHGDSSAS